MQKPVSPSNAEVQAMRVGCACYNLRRAARAVTQLYDAYLEPTGLKATQLTVLAALANTSSSPLTVTVLAESLVLDQSSLSRNLAVLERLGFVKLLPGADRRERIARLTRSGHAALVRAYPRWLRAQEAVASQMNEGLDGQLRALRRMTTAVLDVPGPRERARPRRASRPRSGAPA